MLDVDVRIVTIGIHPMIHKKVMPTISIILLVIEKNFPSALKKPLIIHFSNLLFIIFHGVHYGVPSGIPCSAVRRRPARQGMSYGVPSGIYNFTGILSYLYYNFQRRIRGYKFYFRGEFYGVLLILSLEMMYVIYIFRKRAAADAAALRLKIIFLDSLISFISTHF